jgi:hypothetical protein
VREVIWRNLPEKLEESFSGGMINYVVPLSIFPSGYHTNKGPLPFASLAAQKNHLALYLFNVYGSKELEEWFRSEYAKTGKKLDMGKSCLRFKRASDLPLDLIGELFRKQTVEQYIAQYQKALAR